MSPRPILKRTPSSPCYDHPDLPFYGIQEVHFAPSPTLTHTYDAYPSTAYDRSPIVVAPNSCALPERGGRTYTIDEGVASSSHYSPKTHRPSAPRSGHVHPRALPSHSSSPYTYPYPSAAPPPLVPDLSSESEESDGFTSPPPEPSSLFSRSGRSTPFPCDKYPHSPFAAPSIPIPPNNHPHNPHNPYSSSPDSKRPSRRERERTVRSSPSSRRPLSEHDPGYDDDRDTPVSCSPSSSPRRRSRTRKSVSLCAAMSSFRIEDDAGCLGGF